MSKILSEHNPSPMKLEVMGVEDWPLETIPAGTTTQQHLQTEVFYILSGEVRLSEEDGDPVLLGAEDLVTIMPGQNCRWEVLEALSRHFQIG